MTSDNEKEMFPLVDRKRNVSSGRRGRQHNGSSHAGRMPQREQTAASEELGITGFTPQLLTHYVFESDREKELVFSHRTTYDGIITPSDELDGGRFWTLEDILKALGTGIFTPNFENEFKRLGF